jgi:hypothetical protein
MNPFQVKVFMLKNGLTITSMAEDLADENRKKTSLQVMISDLIYGRRYYPHLAQELDENYGIKIKRPAQIESAREIVKQAA